MAQVEFHTGVADPLAFACRLLRKAFRQGARLAVTAPAATLQTLDRQLWTFDERDFVPHLRLEGPAPAHEAVRRTPIWLLPEGVPWPAGAPAVQVNLGAALDPALPQVDRLIEIVSADTDEAQQARTRWREFKQRGHVIVHHAAAGEAR